MGFRFADPSAFQYFFLILAYVLLLIWSHRANLKDLKIGFHPRAWEWSAQSRIPSRQRWTTLFHLLALTLMILALGRPQSGESQQKAKSEGVEVVVAIDVSTSMLAEDSKPSRLELTKREVNRLLDMLSGDKVGLVAFAGSAVTLSPLTPDKNSLKMFIDSLTPEAVSTQGTSFAKALREAHQLLMRGGLSSDETTAVTKVVVLISDGEDFDKGAQDEAQNLKKDGVRIFSLLVGTEKGAPIPMRDGRGTLLGYKKDNANQVVMSQATGKTLQLMASLTGGEFGALTFGGNGIPLLKQNLDKLEKAQFESLDLVQYNEIYQYFLLPAFALALVPFLISRRRKQGRLWKGRFEVKLR